MPSDPDFVELVPHDGSSAAPTPDRDVLPGSASTTGLLGRRRWWCDASPAGRRLAALAAGFAALTVVATLAAVEQPRRVEVVTRRVVINLPSGVDALGCPVRISCGVRRPTAMVTAVRLAVHSVRILDASEVFGVTSGVVYRRELVARFDRRAATLRLVAQCVPGAQTMGHIPESIRAALDPRTLVPSIVIERIVTPAPGCTSYAMVQAPDPGARGLSVSDVDGRLTRLVRDPAVTVRP